MGIVSMQPILTRVETRVLGALVEKSVTTREQYPLSLNALRAACNQKSSREPVMDLGESEIEAAIESLREKHLAWQIARTGSRTTKYKHGFTDVIPLSPAQLAVLCVLMLRGPQTPGELRGRTGRLHEFSSLGEVDEILQELVAWPDGPLAEKLTRQTGRKECRYAHLLCGDAQPPEPERAVPEPAAPREADASDERVTALEAQVTELQAELEEIRAQFVEFKRQFE